MCGKLLKNFNSNPINIIFTIDLRVFPTRNVGGVFPSTAFANKRYKFRAFKGELDKVNDSPQVYSIAKHYRLEQVSEFLPAVNYPHEIVDLLCENMTANHVGVHVSSKFSYPILPMKSPFCYCFDVNLVYDETL